MNEARTDSTSPWTFRLREGTRPRRRELAGARKKKKIVPSTVDDTTSPIARCLPQCAAVRKSCSVALSHATSCAHRRDDSYRLRPLHRRPIPPSPLLPPTALLLVSTPVSCANLSLHLLTQARCPIRGPRQPFLSSFGIHLCIAEPLYPQRLPRWLPRRC